MIQKKKRATLKVYEDSWEEDTDKKQKKIDAYKNINKQGGKNLIKKITLHGKPRDISEKLKLNSDTKKLSIRWRVQS